MIQYIDQEPYLAVERRFAEWQAQTPQGEERVERTATPVIAVGGLHGALREEVALRLAGALGFCCFDHEILEQISENCHTPESRLYRLDEHRINQFSEALAGFDVQSHVHASEYFYELTKVIREIAARGGAVIVGHGARYILDPGSCFRVFVTASRAHRIKNIERKGHLDQQAAEAEIRWVEADRADFIRDYFGADIRQLEESADLVVNVGSLGVDAAVDTVLAAYRVRFGAPE